MGLFTEDYDEVDPEIIPWSTKDAAFLPVYIGGFFLSLLFLIPHLNSGFPILAIPPAFISLFLLWKSARAYEAHRNLRKLQKLYRQLKNQR